MSGFESEDQLRSYMRNRMAGEIPSEFLGNVMNEVHQTDQRRRRGAWPMLTGLATVAAAVVIVVLGLNLLNRDGGVGADATPSPSATGASASAEPSASASAEASEPASVEASASASAEATSEDGAFGPIHSMAPDEAFDNAQTCENPGAFSNAERTDITYRISFPDGWFTNAGNEAWAACSLFAAEEFDVAEDGTVPEQVAVTVNVPPGGDFDPGGASFTTEEYTVDGVAAVRYDIEPTDGGFVSEPAVVWIIAIRGSLPAEGNDQPYLAISTNSDNPDVFDAWVDVLDRMIATLDVGG